MSNQDEKKDPEKPEGEENEGPADGTGGDGARKRYDKRRNTYPRKNYSRNNYSRDNVQSFRDLEVYKEAQSIAVEVNKGLFPKLAAAQASIGKVLSKVSLLVPARLAYCYGLRFQDKEDAIERMFRVTYLCNRMIVCLDQARDIYLEDKEDKRLSDELLERTFVLRIRIYNLLKTWRGDAWKEKGSWNKGNGGNWNRNGQGNYRGGNYRGRRGNYGYSGGQRQRPSGFERPPEHNQDQDQGPSNSGRNRGPRTGPSSGFGRPGYGARKGRAS